MTERRALTDAIIAPTPKPSQGLTPEERRFAFGERAAPASPTDQRTLVSTRIRSDLAKALKRASLQRQMDDITPNTLQEILEEAIEPWLRSHGYLS